MFFNATMISVLSFCITAWGGNASAGDKCKVDRILKKVSKITNESTDDFKSLLDTHCANKVAFILKDKKPPSSKPALQI